MELLEGGGLVTPVCVGLQGELGLPGGPGEAGEPGLKVTFHLQPQLELLGFEMSVILLPSHRGSWAWPVHGEEWELPVRL